MTNDLFRMGLLVVVLLIGGFAFVPFLGQLSWSLFLYRFLFSASRVAIHFWLIGRGGQHSPRRFLRITCAHIPLGDATKVAGSQGQNPGIGNLRYFLY
jgi:hypothetical protein